MKFLPNSNTSYAIFNIYLKPTFPLTVVSRTLKSAVLRQIRFLGHLAVITSVALYTDLELEMKITGLNLHYPRRWLGFIVYLPHYINQLCLVVFKITN